MLKELAEYGERAGVPPPGFAPKPARWAIMFTQDGRYLGVAQLGDTEANRNRGRTFPKAPDLSQGELIAGGVTRSHFLIDTAEVVTLLDADKASAKKQVSLRAKHECFVELLRQAGTELPSLAGAADTLSDPETMDTIRCELADRKAKPTDKVTLQIGDGFPVESDAWHAWWTGFRQSLVAGEESGQRMRCLLTGELAEPAATHLPKIKGLGDVEGMPTGSVLVGFDKDAFASYGLRQSANAAVSGSAAATYCAALNDLIAHHSHRLGRARVVHWFKEEITPEDDPVAFLLDPGDDVEDVVADADDVRVLIAQQRAAEFLLSLHRGQRPDLAGNHYYALTLSGAAGRVMVRDWMEGQFEELGANILAWFEDLSIVHRAGGRLAPWPKFLAVLAATARELDDVPAPRSGKLWRVALRNEPLPLDLLAQALSRTRLDVIQDRTANHARLGLLKAYHVRRKRLRKNGEKGGSDMSETLTPYLNEEHPEPAYQCGRLLAVLAQLQRSALGDVGAGVVQRYYAAASSTPGLILGRLVRTSQFHLDKLEGGLAWWYQQKLGDIMGRLKDAIPRTLDLEQQSLFALGYYQQLADLRTKKEKQPERQAADEQTVQPV